jgi:hypothetical protein
MTKEQLTIKVDRDRFAEVSVGDLLALEEGRGALRAKVNIVAAFVQNGNGDYMEAEAAQKAVRLLSLRQLNTTLAEVMRDLNEVAVPNE